MVDTMSWYRVVMGICALYNVYLLGRITTQFKHTYEYYFTNKKREVGVNALKIRIMILVPEFIKCAATLLFCLDPLGIFSIFGFFFSRMMMVAAAASKYSPYLILLEIHAF